MWLGLSIAVFYGAVAVFANFVNKYAVQVLPLPTTILLTQTLTTVILLRAMAVLQLIRVPPLRAVRVQKLAPLAICYSVHAVLVLYSLAFLSVPMYNTLKRLTPVMVLATKAVMEKRWPDAQTTFSVLLIVSGCMVAGAGDLSFDGQGYTLALFCAFMQAAYILLAERASGGGGGGGGSGGASHHGLPRRKYHASGADLSDVEGCGKPGEGSHGGQAYEGSVGGGKQALAMSQAHSTGVVVHANPASSRGGAGAPASLGLVQSAQAAGAGGGGDAAATSTGPLSATELLYSICVISVPALTAVCLVSGEGARAPHLLRGLRLSMGPLGFAAWLSVTAVTEGLLTGSVILCTQMNSALTTSIVGVLKGAVSSVLGFFLLGGVKFHVVNVAGITMNMVGGIWYSAIQYLRKGKS